MPIKPIFDKPNIIITGGAGFIGSHLCDELVKNSKVICIDNFISGSQLNIDHLLVYPDFRFIKHDLNLPIDLEALPELERFEIKFQGVQEIYHLACPTSPKDFEKYRIDTLLANSYGMKNVLDLAVKYKAKFLQASTSVVYGNRSSATPYFKEDFIGEVDLLSPRACYDEGKRYAETMAQTYADVFGIDIRLARIFRTYGPRMPLRHGHMIPDFIMNAIDNEPLRIFGDSNFSSSLVYVSDVVDGLVKLMSTADNPGPVNIGSDIDLKIADVAQKIIDLTVSKSTIEYSNALMFMTQLGLPDINRAKNVLGW